VKRVLLGIALAGIIAAVPSALGRSPIEPPRACEGLTICGPVAGPWVVVPGPASGAGVGSSNWMLSCPRGVVGGTDARVGDPWVDVSFGGRIGAPVNPGITTGRTIVFTALSVDRSGRPSSFLPFIGCIPSEGGSRAPTAVGAAAGTQRLSSQSSLSQAIVRRTHVIEVFHRRVAAGFGCRRGERLVSSTTSIGLFTSLKPTLAQIRGVRVSRSVSNGRIFVTVRRLGLPRAVPVEVQVQTACAGVA
jgi:hypothetical protein